MTEEERRVWDAEAADFDRAADHGLHDPAVRAAWAALLTSLLPAAPARVADLGCGTGTLSLLLSTAGHRVDGVDISPEMLRLARTKLAGRPSASLTLGDAGAPPLPRASYDVVLCRHVLWTLPSPAEVLARWVDLLTPAGRLVLVEGSWSTGAGLTGAQTVALVQGAGLVAEHHPLTAAAYWGRTIDDERYVVVGRRLPKQRESASSL